MPDLFRLLGRAHVLDIMYVLNVEADAPVRFVDLQKRLAVSPNTLSERLKDLAAHGLVARHAYAEIPPRVEYEATAKGRALRDVFRALSDWARSYDLTAQDAEPEGARA